VKQDVVCERVCKGDVVGSSGSSAHDLSHDVLVQAAHRLGFVAAGVGLVGVVAFLFHLFVRKALGWSPPAPSNAALAKTGQLGLLAMSLAMLGAARAWGHSNPRKVLNAGLAYQVAGAVLITMSTFWGDHFLADEPGHMTWLGIWIVLFPLIVPAPPKYNLAVALLTATVAPAVFLSWSWHTSTPLPVTQQLVGTFLPYYLCAAMAVVPAWLTWRLNASICAARRQARELGSYQLQERLGQGGMGEVWRAEHRMLARPAAIKLIKSELLAKDGSDDSRSTALARFEREARSTAALQSPHTIGLYDFGVTDDGTFYYVMELLQGIDVETLVEKHGPICPARVVHLLRQACASLAEAHDAGLIHRDIKPANLFVCRLGLELDFVKVLDFGLVRHDPRGPVQGASAKLTGEGYVVGTPAYMAPEQAESEGQVDARADLYSLGCVAYWLLTGKLVFQHDSAMRMLIDHIKTTPKPPSTHLDTPLPEELEQVIMDCLAKDPLQRPASAMDLADRLAACDVPPWTQPQAQVWWREHLPEALESHGTVSRPSFDVYAPTVAMPGPAPRPEKPNAGGVSAV
jgi:serine/threonine-protein kinase